MARTRSDNPALRWMISVDDHTFEPPDLWTSRAAERDKDRVPQVRRGDDGVDYWAYEDVRTPVSGVLIQAGRDSEEIDPAPVNYEDMLPAYYDSAARLEYMNKDHVLASLCFPFFPRFCGQTFYEADDKELALSCLTAYNDWMIEEWAGAAPDRYLPLMIMPLWDPPVAAREIERCAEKGAKAVTFSENPAKLGLPSIHDQSGYWDPILRAINDTGLPMAIHFGSSSSVPTTSDDAPLLVTGALSPISLAFCLTDWLFSGLLPKYPDLRILMSEGGIGWIPYMLERCDTIVKTQEWTQRTDFKYDLGSGQGESTGRGGMVFEEPPSTLFDRHFYGCFIDDEFGCQQLDRIGEDNVMIETDFPHGDSTFPNSFENALSQLDHVSDETLYKIFQGNARKLFDLDIPEVPSGV